jgi:hypothetical protein
LIEPVGEQGSVRKSRDLIVKSFYGALVRHYDFPRGIGRIIVKVASGKLSPFRFQEPARGPIRSAISASIRLKS